MKKRILSLLLALCMLCSLLPGTALAADILTYEVPGTNIVLSYFVHDDGTLTIADCNKDASGELEIPEEIDGHIVTSIRDYAFHSCDSLTRVTIPDSVASIGYLAFYHCIGLTSVNIPNSVTSIGDYTFGDCDNLATVNIPNSVTRIGTLAFDYCRNLTYIRVAADNPNYTDVDGVLFSKDMTSLHTYPAGKQTSSYNIPDSVTRIGRNAFEYCANLTSMTFPDSIEYIDQGAFACCYNLERVIIPKSVTAIEKETFLLCRSLSSVELPDTVTYLGTYAFAECALTDITIPSSVVNIDSYALGYNRTSNPSIYAKIEGFTIKGYCNTAAQWYATKNGFNFVALDGPTVGGMTDTYTVPDTNIVLTYTENKDGTLTITDCNADASGTADIPMKIDGKTVSAIGNYAFLGCNSLTSVNIPDSVTSIGDEALSIGIIYATSFRSNLTNIRVAAGNSNYTDVDGVLFNKDMTLLHTYPVGKQDSVYSIPSGVTSIADYAFFDCTSLTNLTIPDSVTRIGDYAFADCANLTTTIPNSITSIGDYAFFNCASLTSATIPSGVTRIGDYAFSGCRSLTEVTIPDSVTSIGERAFSDCISLTSVTIPNSITRIEDSTFVYCIGLTSVTIPDSVTSIGNGAFSGCSNLTSVTIPNSVTSIGKQAFGGCPNLTDIYYGGNMTQWHAIEGTSYQLSDSNDGLTHAVIHCTGEVFNIENGILVKYDGSGGNVVIPDGVTIIGDWAFYACPGLTSVTIPNSVASIGNGAFSGCSNLTSVTIPNSVTSIGNSTFNYCRNLTDVYYGGSQSQWNAIAIGSSNDALTHATIHYNSGASTGDFTIENGVLVRYNGTGGNVVIPDGVTSIGESAFRRCTSLTSVTIPDGVISIGANAFLGCTRLASVTIPNSVTSIGDGAFSECTGMTSVTIPDGVTSIGNGVFFDCGSLTSVTIPDGVTSIGNFAFQACNSLTSVAIPNSVTSIGESAFRGCTSLTSVTIPDGVTSIGDDAFRECTGLTSVNIPNSVTSIGAFAFGECYSLTSVNIPNSVTSIGNGAFLRCSGLTSVTIPDSVTSIGDSAFYRCIELTSMNIPNSVTSIGGGAFLGCRLTNVTIPDSVTSIGANAFSECLNLTYIRVAAGNPNYTDVDGVLFSKDMTLLHIYPAGKQDSVYSIPSGVTSIGSRAFGDCRGLTSVTIPESVTSIGGNAFVGCTGLTSVTIPNSVTSVGAFAFYDCPSLTDVYYGGSRAQWNAIAIGSSNDGLTNATIHYSGGDSTGDTTSDFTIENGVLVKYNGSGGNVVIPDGVTSIGDYAFYECTGLTSVTIPDGVTSIGGGAFSGCSDLTYIHVAADNPNYTDVDGVLLSKDMTLLHTYPSGKQTSSYNIPSGVTRIEEQAFYECTNLTSVTIPDGVTSIGGHAFWSCSSLTNVNIPTSVKSVGAQTFYGCSSLTSITIPNGVTEIEQGTFSGCTSLTNVTIPSSVTRIGWYAFAQCSNLKSVTIPKSVTTIDAYVFLGCTGLTDIYYGGSQAQWKAIEIGDFNDSLSNATIHYSGNGGNTGGGGGGSIGGGGGGVVIAPPADEEQPTTVSTYNDVPANAWYNDAVAFVTEKGLMNGTDASTFAPNSNLTRAMLAQILYNNEGKPATSGGSFTDVQSGAWYVDAITWASQQGIVGGYGNGRVGPNDSITREQLAVMLWRYAGQPTSNASLSGFTDTGKASNFALTALQWAVEKGIISGKGNGILDPTGNATRAEVAQMLMNYFK